jgi:seryl-tRNA synthetase
MRLRRSRPTHWAMLDPRSLDERRDEVAASCRKRGVAVDVEGAIAAQTAAAALQTELNEANRLRNEHQEAGKRKLSPDEREAHTAEGRRRKEHVTALEERLAAARAALDERIRTFPNFVHPDVPSGGEADFREPRRFDFAPADHVAIGQRLGLFDFEAGAKVTGQKFYFLSGEAVLLDLALQRFALDLLLEEGFRLYTTPDLARRRIVDAMAFSPRGPETQIYSVEGTDLDLIGTAEITLGGIYEDTVLEEDDLPIRIGGISHCYRTEAGSAGRESKGLYRVHQFTKVEMFAFTRPEDAEAMHAELLRIEERVFTALEVPYRVIDIAAGDLGAPAYRKFDIEAWLPGRGERGDWGEVTSTSNCTDFQARRLKTRFRRKGSKKNELVYTLNGTAVAIARALIALLENHQQADGSVHMPKALRPYTGFDRIGPR